MKVQIICEQCNNFMEFPADEYNHHIYFNRDGKGKFIVDHYNVGIENDVSPSLDTDFVEDLVNATDEDEVTQILEERIDGNVSVEHKLTEMRIDCGKCDNYFVLTNL